MEQRFSTLPGASPSITEEGQIQISIIDNDCQSVSNRVVCLVTANNEFDCLLRLTHILALFRFY